MVEILVGTAVTVGLALLGVLAQFYKQAAAGEARDEALTAWVHQVQSTLAETQREVRDSMTSSAAAISSQSAVNEAIVQRLDAQEDRSRRISDRVRSVEQKVASG